MLNETYEQRRVNDFNRIFFLQNKIRQLKKKIYVLKLEYLQNLEEYKNIKSEYNQVLLAQIGKGKYKDTLLLPLELKSVINKNISKEEIEKLNKQLKESEKELNDFLIYEQKVLDEYFGKKEEVNYQKTFINQQKKELKFFQHKQSKLLKKIKKRDKQMNY